MTKRKRPRKTPGCTSPVQRPETTSIEQTTISTMASQLVNYIHIGKTNEREQVQELGYVWASDLVRALKLRASFIASVLQANNVDWKTNSVFLYGHPWFSCRITLCYLLLDDYVVSSDARTVVDHAMRIELLLNEIGKLLETPSLLNRPRFQLMPCSFSGNPVPPSEMVAYSSFGTPSDKIMFTSEGYKHFGVEKPSDIFVSVDAHDQDASNVEIPTKAKKRRASAPTVSMADPGSDDETSV